MKFQLAISFLAIVLVALLNACESDSNEPAAIVDPTPDYYVPNQIIIEFQQWIINKEALCYEGPLTDEVRARIMSQQFPIDSLIMNVDIQAVLDSIDGDYLQRIFSLNPCTDTLSISRTGDTLRVPPFYATLLLHLKEVPGKFHDIELMGFHLQRFYWPYIIHAQPNYIYSQGKQAKTP